MPQYELSLRDYWRIIKKKRIIVITTVILLGMFSFIFALMNRPEPIYQAVASLKIEKITSLAGLYNYYWSGGDDLATRAEEIKSYPIIEKAAQAMGLIDSNLTSDEIRNNPKLFSIILRLKEKVKTEQEGYTNIINILVKSPNPYEARDLANALAKVYVKESFKERNKQITQALETIKTQLDNAKRAMEETERKVREYRSKHRFITLDNSSSRLLAELTKVEADLDAIRNDIKQIDNLIAEINSNPDYLYYTSVKVMLNNPTPLLSSLQAQLSNLRDRLQQYSNYYTEEHPIIKNIKSQIASLKNRFVEELKAYRKSLLNNEQILYEKWKNLDEEYRNLPLYALTLADLERELSVNTKIYEELQLKYQDALIRKSEMVQEVYLLRPAFLPTSPINPSNVGPTTAVGIVLGLILGVILAFVAETLDTTFSTIDEIEKTLDTTVLGVIPHVDMEEHIKSLESKITTPITQDILEMQARVVSHFNPKSTMAEAFRSLRTNIHFGLMDKGYKTISITSSVAAEGKTTIAVNLAVSMAQIGLNTLLIEADLRRPKISKIFGIDREPGLTDIILKRAEPDETIRTMSDLITGTMATEILSDESIPGIEYLNILPAGKSERNPSEILASRFIDELIENLKNKYDIIILDTSPIMQATDATILSTKVDTTIIAYYQGKVSRGTLRRAKSQLDMLKSDVMGVVINGMRADVSADYYTYKYSYEYYYTYGSEEEEQKNKIVAFLKRQFLKPPTSPSDTFLKRLRKLKIMGLSVVLISLILMGSMLINLIKKTESQKALPPNLVSKDTSLTVKTQSGIPPISQPASQTKKEQEIIHTEQIDKKGQISQQTITALQQTVTKPYRIEYINEDNLQINKLQSFKSKIIKLNRPFTLLIKSFSDEEEAINYKNELSNIGIDAVIIPNFQISGFNKFLVCFGNFSTPEEAKSAAPTLMFHGIMGKFIPLNLGYTIFIGEYKSLSKAKGKLQNLKYDEFANIKKIYNNSGEIKGYRLYLGRFKNTEMAENFLFSQLNSIINQAK